MKLSVIIVNYNVKYFLEQCLHSVQKAIKGISSEIFVVDNNSVDGSAQLIQEKFPGVKFIANKDNVGFSRANNQAIKQSKGEYILLLNPDTVVEEDTFEKTTAFMDAHPEAGGLGVKMIDGKGVFLPESKRGLPSPWVAFYKIFGISKLFPKSKTFGKYHLSFLNENDINEVDVLAGAFMMLRKKVLDKIGLLDETFFMYGEDIDLSYRIQLGGYKNFYFPETTIIHYKGESTKKGSLNYVRVFYNAMAIFAKKHFPGNRAGIFTFFIQLAIYFRAFLAICKRIFQKIYLPLIDTLLIFCGFLFLIPLWESIRFHTPGYYPPDFYNFVLPVYVLFFLVGIWLSGGYKKPVNIYRLARGILWGLIALLLAYSLADEEHRFSRALILLGAVWTSFSTIIFRILGHWLKIDSLQLDIQRKQKIAIVAHPEEANRVKHILEETQIQSQLAGFIAIDNADNNNSDYIGTLAQIEEIIRINSIDEIIFCSENISSATIINAMLTLSHLDIDYKIAPPKSLSIIGSNSIHTAGDLYVINLNAISKKTNRAKKRFFDITCSLLTLFLSPLLIWSYKKKRQFIQNIFNVITGSKTWVSYLRKKDTFELLPRLKKGVLTPGDFFPVYIDKEKATKINMLYAKDYSPGYDIKLIFKAWKKLDRK